MKDLPSVSSARSVIEETLLGAGTILADMFSTEYGVREKLDGSLVTDADMAAHRFIKGQLEKRFPHIEVKSEEGRGDSATSVCSEAAWIVDPLDGTENYASRNPHFGVAIGLWAGGEVIAGGISQPFVNVLYSFGLGYGASLNGKPMPSAGSIKPKRDARVAFIPTREISKSAAAGQAHSALLRACRRVVDNWAPALDWCGLAAGDLDAVVSIRRRSTTPEFDALIGQALFHEALQSDAYIEHYPFSPQNTNVVLEIASGSAELLRELRLEFTAD